MSSTFKYHSNVDEVVPWQATYTFPSQATKVNKQTVKLVPKNGSTFSANNIVRIEFPADNYLNVLNSCLQFDVQTTITDTTSGTGVIYGTATNRAANASANRLKFTFSATSGTIHTGGSDDWTDYYNGYTVAVTTSKGTFYSVVGASAYDHADGSDAALFTFELLQPLPVDFADDATYKLTIIPPYLLQRGGSQNFIKRLRIIYGSIVLEDIMEYKSLVRLFYETGVDPGMASGSGAILEGMYGCRNTDGTASSSWFEAAGSVPVVDRVEAVNSLLKPVASQIAYSGALPSGAMAQLLSAPAINSTTGAVLDVDTLPTFSNSGRTTYCINLLSGLLTQKKLIPLKWMAAQLAIEITLAPVEECFLGAGSSTINYKWSNVNFIAEMLEFDSAYDTAFYQGLMSNGVPIKFSSFHYHSFNLSGAYNILQIHERSRSVKAAYAVARDTTTPSVTFDTDRFFFALGETWSNGTIANGGEGQIQQFQWRVGGRYYPAQPIRTTFGGAEAMMELQKALDMLGDYTRQGNFSRRSWTINNGGNGGAFILAAPFENTDIFPETISGINAEEQSDIALFITSDSNTTPNSKKLDVFMHYDALVIVRDGNVVDLVL